MPKSPIAAGQTSTAGIVVTGLARLPADGNFISLTLHFEHAAPVTIDIRVVVDAGPSAASSGS
jgi:hypothetical protein